MGPTQIQNVHFWTFWAKHTNFIGQLTSEWGAGCRKWGITPPPCFPVFLYNIPIGRASKKSFLEIFPKCVYPPKGWFLWDLGTQKVNFRSSMTYLFDGDAIPRPQKTVILRVRSPDYIVKSTIFKVWVISATSMHEIILHAIDMHKNRFKTNF